MRPVGEELGARPRNTRVEKAQVQLEHLRVHNDGVPFAALGFVYGEGMAVVELERAQVTTVADVFTFPKRLVLTHFGSVEGFALFLGKSANQ